MKTNRPLATAAAAVAALSLTTQAIAQNQTVKIGAISILEGAFAAPGADALRGLELAFKETGMMAGGARIEVVKASSAGTPDSAVAAAKKLVEQEKVQIVIGPVGGSEGIAIKEYAKTQPHVVFVNGSSAAQETTLVNPAPNFFRFSSDGAQWQVGLGEYAVRTKGYKKIVTLAEDYSFPYSQISGFMNGYCKAGGRVVEKLWVPVGNKDYASVIARIPADVDAVYVALGGADAVSFLSQYEQSGGDKPLIGGTVTVDQTVLGYKGKKPDYVVGTISAGPMADSIDTAEWKKFVSSYKTSFPDAFHTPSIFATLYYINAKAVAVALEQTRGDTKGLLMALRNVKFVSPLGEVKIDSNRNGISNTYITEVAKNANGQLFNRVVRTVGNVDQNLGMSKEEFMRSGVGSRNTPALCNG